jgi:hypothetical protein
MEPKMEELSRLQRKRVARWRRAITNAWQKQVHAVITTGLLLIRAHDDLIPIHGAWINMVINDLPFSYATAKKLMAIAHHPVLSDGSHGNHLPSSWTTLYQLSLIDEATLSTLIESGEVNPKTERQDVERLRHMTPAGAAIAVVTHSSTVKNAMQAWRAANTRAFNSIWDFLTNATMTDAELTLVLQTCADIADQIDGFTDAVGKMHVREMHVINEPMWEDTDERPDTTTDEIARRGEGTNDANA